MLHLYKGYGTVSVPSLLAQHQGGTRIPDALRCNSGIRGRIPDALRCNSGNECLLAQEVIYSIRGPLNYSVIHQTINSCDILPSEPPPPHRAY